MELDRKNIIPLKGAEVRVITWAEKEYSASGHFPTRDQFENRWGADFNLPQFLSHPTVQLAFKNRGIAIPKENAFPRELSEEQVAAVMSVTNFMDTRSQNTKLRTLGVSSAQWAGWLKNPIFKGYLHEVSSNMLQDNLHTVQEGLLKATQKGSTDAIKFYYELTGRHDGTAPQEQNVRVIFAKLVEVLQKHIHDESTLRAIGRDFDIVMSGGTIQAKAMLDVSTL